MAENQDIAVEIETRLREAIGLPPMAGVEAVEAKADEAVAASAD